MNCETFDAILLDYLYEELAPEDTRHAKQHLETCTSCTAKVASFGNVRSMVHAIPEPTFTAPAYTALLAEAAAVAAKAKAPQKPVVETTPSFREKLLAGLRLLWSPPMAVAASLFLVVGVSFLALQSRAPAPLDSQTEVIAALQQPAATPTETLSQGVAVTLDKNTADPAPAEATLAVTEQKKLVPSKPITAAASKTRGVFDDTLRERSAEESNAAPTIALAPAPAPIATPAPMTPSKATPMPSQRKEALDASITESPMAAGAAAPQDDTTGCAAQEASARRLKGSASYAKTLLQAANCYQTQDQPSKARTLYTEVAALGGTTGAEAQRSLTALETKLSKPSFEIEADSETQKGKAYKKATKVAPASK